MSIRIDGTNTTANPGITGADADTGLVYGTDEVSIVTGGTTQTTVDSSGRLLVGTSSAANNYRVTVTSYAPQVQLVSTTPFGLAVNRTNGDANISIANSSTAANNGTIGRIVFNANDGANLLAAAHVTAQVDGTPGTNDMPGRLVFSTTAAGASSPTERMRINADGRLNTFSSSSVAQIVASNRAAGTSDYIFIGRYAATAIETGVSCYAIYTNGTFQQLSDENLKKNIQTTRSGYLDDLNKLRVVKYNWKSQDDSEPKELGLIAQEVEQVFPGLVSELDTDTDNPHKGIKTSVLPYMLLKALQEAIAKIETLETQNASLEARLTALEGGAS